MGADIAFLYGGNRLDSKSCGWWGLTPETPSLALHNIDLYMGRTAARYPRLRDMANVALKSSYNSNDKSVADFVRAQGYGLVASAVCANCRSVSEDEVSHLIQNPRTLDCWLTFEGSGNNNDWINKCTQASGMPRWPLLGMSTSRKRSARRSDIARALRSWAIPWAAPSRRSSLPVPTTRSDQVRGGTTSSRRSISRRRKPS